MSKQLVAVLSLLLLLCLNVLTIEKVSAQKCSGQWYVENVSGIASNYRPNVDEKIDGHFEYRLNNSSECPNCVQQLVVGIVDQSNVKVKDHFPNVAYNGIPKTCPDYTSGYRNFTFQLNLAPGTYRIVVCNYKQDFYDESRQKFPAATNNTKVLKVITVGTVSPLPPPPSITTPTQPTTVTEEPQDLIKIIRDWVEQINISATQKAEQPPQPPEGKSTEQIIKDGQGEITIIQNWIGDVIPIIMPLIAFFILIFVLIRYLIIKSHDALDKIISLVLATTAGIYLFCVYVVPIIKAWLPIIVVLIIVIVALVILRKTGILKQGGRTPVPPSDSDTDVSPSSFDSHHTTGKEGYIYIMRCPSHEVDLHKIGRTKRHPEQRVKELNGTGVPEEFIVIDHWEVADDVLAEALVHKALDRYRRNKEYFKAPAKTIIPIMKETIENMDRETKR